MDTSHKDFGKKYDSGKPSMALLSSIALEEIAKVMTYGEKKYGTHNWRGGMSWMRILSAVFRHLFAWLKGEDKDSETGSSHLAHAGCGIMFLLEFEQTRRSFDDRYKHTGTGDVRSEALHEQTYDVPAVCPTCARCGD